MPGDHAAARRDEPDAVFFAFDLLMLDGEDLRPLPLNELQARLSALLSDSSVSLMFVDRLTGPDVGEAMLRNACAMGLEGIDAKRRDAPYRSGASDRWLKVKCTQRDFFAVTGMEPSGRAGLKAIRVARIHDDILLPAGSVGSGFSEAAARDVRAALDAGRIVIADVEFRGFTPAGELRHAVFKGWQSE